jgi:hypothetical protein
LHDNANTTRRTPLPWWKEVQAVAEHLGRYGSLQRHRCSSTAPVDWYVSHISGCLVPFAVRLGLRDFEVALDHLAEAVRSHWAARDFDTRWKVETIRHGLPVEGEPDAAE